MATIQVALGQFDTGWHDPHNSLRRVGAMANAAERAGARLLALPEMCTTGWTMDLSHSETLSGPSVLELSRIASSAGLFILAGVAIRSDDGAGIRHFNSAILFSPDGAIVSEYRKQRLFGIAGESDSYAAGGPAQMVKVEGVRIAPFICYDLRFPELFRQVALATDAIVIIANWPVERRDHWDVLTRARAIENLCYLVAVNRIGEGGGARYDGGSVAYDPWGRLLVGSGNSADSIQVVAIDSERVAKVRAEYPFLNDMG